MIKSHLFASQVVHPSTCFVCSSQKTAVLLFGIFFLTWLHGLTWDNLFGRNQQMNRSVKGQWKWWFVLLSEVYFVPDKFFQSMIDVKSKGISLILHIPFSMIVLINWAPLSDGFQAGFLIYTYKKSKQTQWSCFMGKSANFNKTQILTEKLTRESSVFPFSACSYCVASVRPSLSH